MLENLSRFTPLYLKVWKTNMLDEVVYYDLEMFTDEDKSEYYPRNALCQTASSGMLIL